MNEIILIGEVTARVMKSNKHKASIVYLKVKNDINNKLDYIPVYFKCMDCDYLLSLKGKEIAISGHIDSSIFNRIFVDVIKIFD